MGYTEILGRIVSKLHGMELQELYRVELSVDEINANHPTAYVDRAADGSEITSSNLGAHLREASASLHRGEGVPAKQVYGDIEKWLCDTE